MTSGNDMDFVIVHETDNSMPVMSEQEYLNSRSVGSEFSDTSLDKCRFPHGLTSRAHKSLMKTIDKMNNDYYNRRNQAKAEYHRLVNEGKLRDYTEEELKQVRIINLIKRANGDSSFESVQAARRLCEKRGISWQMPTVV